jgi:predicted KAP-like P-loop ATPase
MDKGPENSEDVKRKLSDKVDNMTERMDDQDAKIEQLREELGEDLDVLHSRIENVKSEASRVESTEEMYEYMVDIEEQLFAIKERLKDAMDEEFNEE